MTVKEIMTTVLISVTMDDTFARVNKLILEKEFHHLLVLEEGALVGIISDRDVLKGISPFLDKPSERIQDRVIMDLKVHQFMTRHPITVKPDLSINKAVSIMGKNNISSLPVQDGEGKLLGIVTSNDIIKWAAKKDLGD